MAVLKQSAAFLLLFAFHGWYLVQVDGQVSRVAPLNKSRRSTAILNKILENMDRRIRPDADGPPIEVTAGFYVNSFGSISETDMEYTVDVFLRQSWLDERLDFLDESPNATKPLTLTSESVKQIWTPDLFFPNEKKASFHMATVPNQLMRVFPNGTIAFSQRFTLTLSCPMVLTHFPMDTQECNLFMQSFSYDLDEMRLKWMKPIGVQFNENLELPQFELISHTLREFSHRYHTGRFSSLQAKFELHRNFGFYLLQTYVPSILIVILSWVSFWISMEAVPARISLGVTTVLTMTTQFSGSRAGMPRVSYPKAIDVWMAMCMVFVFAALVEYAFVNVLERKEGNRKRREEMNPNEEHKSDIKMIPRPADLYADDSGEKRKSVTCCLWCFRDKLQLARGIDKFSRIVFPLIFVIFNIVYWPMYLNPR